MNKIRAAPESEEIVKLRQQYDREIYDLRVEVGDLRVLVERGKIWREAAVTMSGWLARYQRALRSLGYTPPDDELALHDHMRQELEK
jgi:hypothetical protein